MKIGMIAVGLLLSAGVIPLASGEEELTHRVSEEEATKAIKSKVNPEYPAMARQMKLTGTVIVDVFIDTGGKVEKVQVVRGNALLTSAAVEAIISSSQRDDERMIRRRIVPTATARIEMRNNASFLMEFFH